MENRGSFHVAVSGGSLPKFLKGLSKRADIDWTQWWVYFCDERYVSNDDPDSNYGALSNVLLGEVRCFLFHPNLPAPMYRAPRFTGKPLSPGHPAKSESDSIYHFEEIINTCYSGFDTGLADSKD